jgi:hypothetical protein
MKFRSTTLLVALVLFGCTKRAVPPMPANVADAGTVVVVQETARADAETSRADAGAAIADAGAANVLPYRVASSAVEGCRALSDTGCRSCCRPLAYPFFMRCQSPIPGSRSARFQCSVARGSCENYESRCARCSLHDEQELATLAPMLHTFEGPVDIYSMEDLEKCRGKTSPRCIRMRWTEAATNCQSVTSKETQGPLPQLPYTIDSRMLVGCRDVGTPDCERCARTVPSPTKVEGCAYCMIEDERLLREATKRLKGCDCSTVVHGGFLVNGCKTPESCSCACREWVTASLRCPPAKVLSSQAGGPGR